MNMNRLSLIFVAAISFTMLTGFIGFKDLTKSVKLNTGDCKDAKNKSNCKNKKHLENAGKIVAAGLAAKAIYDVIVHFTSKQTQSEKEVAKKYKKKNKNLPDNPEVFAYASSLKPGQVVPTGKPIKIVSEVQVVQGKKTNKVSIQEKIEFYDFEDKTKVIKSLVKDVNKQKQQAGTYENTFTFTLPKGMPQGIYRIRTAVLLDSREAKTSNNDMQVVFLNLPGNDQPGSIQSGNTQQVAMILP